VLVLAKFGRKVSCPHQENERCIIPFEKLQLCHITEEDEDGNIHWYFCHWFPESLISDLNKQMEKDGYTVKRAEDTELQQERRKMLI
jgi:hypothetical protein